MSTLPTPPECHLCYGYNVWLHYQITASGTRQYFWYCEDCERITPRSTYIPHATVLGWMEGWSLGQRARFNNERLIKDLSARQVCAVCGEPGTEYHHWAPQAYRDRFGPEWNHWPTVFLCRKHHRQWHEIVTPTLIRMTSYG